jgi:hypothetical protein
MPTTTSTTPSLNNLLEATTRTHEAGLVIARDSAAQKRLIQSLEQAGLKRTTVTSFKPAAHGSYVVIEDRTQYKDAYDFVCQYPTTVVSLYDAATKQMVVMRPDYRTPLVFVMTDATLASMSKAGFDLRGRIGPVLRFPYAKS